MLLRDDLLEDQGTATVPMRKRRTTNRCLSRKHPKQERKLLKTFAKVGEQAVKKAKGVRLRNAPGLDKAKNRLTLYGLVAGSREAVAYLAEHGIGAVNVKNAMTIEGQLVIEVAHFGLLDQLPGIQAMGQSPQGEDIYAIEVNSICVMCWRIGHA